VPVIDRLRRWVRHVGIGERRWIPEPEERHRHAALVRRRLRASGPDAMPPGQAGPDPAPRDSTDSVIPGG